MRPRLPSVLVATVLGALVLAGAPSPVAVGAPRVFADAPTHTLGVAGTGVAMYPAFDPADKRYGVTTTADTGGVVTVTATTSDPTGTVYVDGRPTADGTATVTGLTEGDEISVFINDSAGTEKYAVVYLTAGFPALQRVAAAPDATGILAPGKVLVGLSTFTGGGLL